MSDMLLMLAVNNPDNGCDSGRVCAITFEYENSPDFALELEDGDMVCRRESDGSLRIGRRRFPIHGYATWVGNWCWDCARVTTETAQEIAEYLRASGKWHLLSGYEELFEAWESGAPLRFTD